VSNKNLLAKLAREGEQERGTIPVGLYRGVVRPIPTVVRTGTVVYGRADMPEDFAYIVAEALNEQQHLLQWKHLNFSYNVHNMWKAFEVPLHPGAARGHPVKTLFLEGHKSTGQAVSEKALNVENARIAP